MADNFMEEILDEYNVAGYTVIEDVGLSLSHPISGDAPKKFIPLHIFDNLLTSMLNSGLCIDLS